MDTMQKIISLCKRRGLVFPGSEIYGGLANTWDYGPYGVEIIKNIKDLWWERFVKLREDIVGIQSAILMHPRVWESSGHVAGFTDPLSDCKKCKKRWRSDQHQKCPECGGELTGERKFNLMFKTFIGPVESEASAVYLRPETAQGMFVNFKNVKDTARKKLPFGIAQIGKAFRNEITPGNFVFRFFEFDQMEIEYFIEEKNWKKEFKNWQSEMEKWCWDIGLTQYKIREHDQNELSHYSKKTIDIEYIYPFGQKELYGLAYRTNYDLRAHGSSPDAPHVIEPTFGVDRTFLAIICEAYKEEKDRIVLKLKPEIAPIKVAVFPLLRNQKELVKKAREVFTRLKVSKEFDDNGNIGKRYRRQDEIGTPHCLTIDFETLKNNTVTVRERDSMKQKRVEIDKLCKSINQF